jgi:hypothetical protein
MNEENLKHFPPGISGNPAGRPKGARSLSTVLKEMLEENVDVIIDGQPATKKMFKEVIIRRLLKAANDGDIRAIQTIFDRVDGKAAQFIEMQIPGGVDSLHKHEVIFKDMSQPRRKKSKPKPKKDGNKKQGNNDQTH